MEPSTAPGHSPRKPRVAVVFGGRSSEHGISCLTAGSVLRAIDRERYDVVPVGITQDGRWVLESAEPSRLALTGDARLPQVDDGAAPLVWAGGDREAGAAELVVQGPASVPQTLGEVDVVFPLLHGPWGEDGTLQGFLEMAGVRYVGAGVLASAVGMDKHYMKVVLQAAGLPVLPSVVIRPERWKEDQAGCVASVDALGYPVFVKPCRGGSSIGISKVHDSSELGEAIEQAQRHDPKVLVEPAAVGGREVECGVLERLDARPEASQAAEIAVGGDHEFYDFAAKYLPEEHTAITVPADLPAEVAEAVRVLSVQAFEALSCEGLARVDFFVLPEQPGRTPQQRLVINEINTMPGFTPTSMFPRIWAASGLDYPALVERLLQLALHRSTGLR